LNKLNGNFIRGEGLIPRPSGAVIKVLNPRPIPLENNHTPLLALNLTHKIEHFPIVVEGVEFL
jgi:hypothetical protein